MPQVIIPADVPSLDGTVRSQAYAFLDKLRRDDTTPGLHIERLEQVADKRVRTGRVSHFWRAVLIKLTGSDDEPRYVYLGTFAHDDAIAYARSVVLQRNPRTSTAEVIRVDVGSAVAPVHEPSADLPSPLTVQAVPVLQGYGITFEELLDLGIAPLTAHAAILAADKDRLLEVAMAAPSAFQTDALLLLGDGTTTEEVRALYRVSPVLDRAGEDTDDDLIAALEHPTSQMQFAYLRDDDALRSAIEEEDFARWRVFLHPEQREHTTATTSGAFRLSGGAGTGKTVVLLHRARHLHRQDPAARIVLTTFNKTLTTTLRANLLLLDKEVRIAKTLGEPGIYLGTVDAISWRLVSRAAQHGLDVDQVATQLLGGPRRGLVPSTDSDGVWTAAIGEAGAALPTSLRTAEFFASEYRTVVLPAQVATREEYLRARRPGRGIALGRAQRNAVWDVIEAYRTACAQSGTTDYDEKAMLAAVALNTAGRHVADHVLVDEAQDLDAVRLRLLRALVAQGVDDLFLAEDSQQRIYAPRTVLSRHGIHVTGRSRRLRLNYRTTAQNLDYAVSLLAGADHVDLEDAVVDVSGARSSRSGPPPRSLVCTGQAVAYERAADQIRRWIADGSAPETIAVLVRTGNEGVATAEALTNLQVPARYYSTNELPGSGRVVVLTMHRSKGMEFRDVVVFGMSQEFARAIERLAEEDRADGLLRERSLLYVATTRARDHVTIIWDGAPSRLFPQPRERSATPTTTTAPGASREERESLAREVHDTVSHSLAQIALHASALEVDADSTPAARERSALIRAAARRANTELRGILTRLRTGAEGTSAVSFDDLTSLLANLKDQGARITSTVLISDGDTADRALTQACYRIVQEAVTNALKHAPGLPIDITLRGAPATGVTLVVQNPLPDGAPTLDPSTHAGLHGMIDRAAALGGSLTAAPTGAQFVVDARLPWRRG